MKLTAITSQIRFFLIILGLSFIYRFSVNAQTVVASDYLKRIGDYAGIYNGQLETLYDPRLYENVPYYKNADFREGDIIYKKNLYPKQRMRLDLYKENLIIQTPERHFGIVIDSKDVEKIVLDNETFVWLNQSQKNGLKEGYYLSLFDGKLLKVIKKEKYILNGNDRISFFNLKNQYYVVLNEQYYPLKNKKGFIRLFPQYKKQINAFAKEYALDFKRNMDRSLILLAKYCEELSALKK